MLDKYTDQELEQELKRRKEQEELKSQRPKPRKNIQIAAIVDYCESYMDALQSGEYRDDDDHYLFEFVVGHVYGKEVWDWINKIIE